MKVAGAGSTACSRTATAIRRARPGAGRAAELPPRAPDQGRRGLRQHDRTDRRADPPGGAAPRGDPAFLDRSRQPGKRGATAAVRDAIREFIATSRRSAGRSGRRPGPACSNDCVRRRTWWRCRSRCCHSCRWPWWPRRSTPVAPLARNGGSGPPPEARSRARRAAGGDRGPPRPEPVQRARLRQAGLFRRLLANVVLFGTNYAARHLFNRANLAGIKTIHFARWVFLDDRRRVIFCSNYDGSLESYMDDFIDKVAWGLNATFSNGYGYPRTRWLVLDGARDELAFKDLLRSHQHPTEVWFSAYPRLTALNIENNARIRAGLYGRMTGARPRLAAASVKVPVCGSWGGGLGGDEMSETLELDDIQGLVARGYGNLSAACFMLLEIADAGPGPRLARCPGRADHAGISARPDDRALNVAFTAGAWRSSGWRPTALALFSLEMRGRDDDRAPPAHPGRRRRQRARAGWGWGGPATRPVDLVLLLYARDEDALVAQSSRTRRPGSRPAGWCRSSGSGRPRLTTESTSASATASPSRPSKGLGRGRPAGQHDQGRRVRAGLPERVRHLHRPAGVPASADPRGLLPRTPTARTSATSAATAATWCSGSWARTCEGSGGSWTRRRARPDGAATRRRAPGWPRRWSGAGRTARRSRSRRTATTRRSATSTTSATARMTWLASTARSARTSGAPIRATRSTRIPAPSARSRWTSGTACCGGAGRTDRPSRRRSGCC